MKKIMFNDKYGLTQAVIDGHKTMTRRIIPDIEVDWNRRGRVKLPVSRFVHGLLFMDASGIQPDGYHCLAPKKCQPRYEVVEEVAVAQSYSNAYDVLKNKYGKDVADDWGFNVFKTLGSIPPLDKRAGWTNKMFVRADLMPYRISITDIKLERLQDISEEDCMREGIRESIVEFGGKKIVQWTYFHEKRTIWFDSPREAFAALINRISGKGTWERNPWVFAYEFELDGE